MTSDMKQTVIKNPTWWKRRTRMERGLTLLAVIAFITIISLVVALAAVLWKSKNHDHHKTHKTSDKDPGICLTPGCINAAYKVLDAMDQSVEPCDDFYKFACGNFDKKTNIPDHKSWVTPFTVISDLLQEQLRTMIEEPIQEDEPKPFKLTKLLYKACMNKTAIEADGLDTILGIMKGFGGWPILEGDAWDETSFDWKETVYKFRRAGYSVDYFIDFSVSTDLKNSSRRIVSLDQASLGLKREFLVKGMDDKLVKAYYDYMVDVSVIFGADRERAKKELRESLEFEMHLANISLPKENRRNSTELYNPFIAKDLQEKYPSIPWLTYINTLLAPDTTIYENEIIIISVPKYMSDLEALIAKTPKRAQANYMLWRAAASSVFYLTEELRNRELKYSTIVTGKAERASRWKECIDISAYRLWIATGALYVRKYFHEDARQNAIQMVANIRAEFVEIVKQVDWMDEKTRQSALEKADSMAMHIAYPDELLDDRKLEGFYRNLEMDPNYYLKSNLNLTLFETQFAYQRLLQPVNKTDWITHGRPAIVNAFYTNMGNSIQFPAGILQGAFFNNDRPKYMNYGAIGFVIGHEITHGFDDQGRQFDKNGNLVDWWEPETQKSFVKKAQCIIDQYGNYTVEEVDLNLNGINTQGENIADNGGIKEAYWAYNRWAKKNQPELKLPGLDLTPNQMFWVSAGQTWCAKYRVESLKLRILTGQHSPGYFRVIGPLSNLEEFSKDFKCPVGSRMNPKNKCKVW